MEDAKMFKVNNVDEVLEERYPQLEALPFVMNDKRSYCNWQRIEVEGVFYELIEYVYVAINFQEIIRYGSSQYVYDFKRGAKKIKFGDYELFSQSNRNEYKIYWYENGLVNYLLLESQERINKNTAKEKLIGVFKNII